MISHLNSFSLFGDFFFKRASRYWLTTETQRAQSKLYFCPIGRRRSGKPGTRQKGGTPSEARRKEPSPAGNLLFALDPEVAVSSETKSLSPSGDGFFPWPSSPGQGKHNLLCGLFASVVKKSAITPFRNASPLALSLYQLVHPLRHVSH